MTYSGMETNSLEVESLYTHPLDIFIDNDDTVPK